MLEPIDVRFWARVEKTDACWLWTGKKVRQGYGQLYNGKGGWRLGRSDVAHRISWVLHNGPIPGGMDVLHHCDNPRCVRPDHLFLGTDIDNVRDMTAKGRRRDLRGSEKYNAKLTDIAVMEARRLHGQTGLSLTALAKRYDVSISCIKQAIRGQTWKHVGNLGC